MFTPDERRAICFLGAVAAAGGAVRVVRGPGQAPGAALVAPAIPAGDLARQVQVARRAEQMARPLAAGETVDVDHAEADELARLPRVGPGLARRIVQERTAHGPFGSLAGLQRVAGLGPATLRGLERQATFSGTPWPQPPHPDGVSDAVAAAGAPRTGTPRSAGTRRPDCPQQPISLNGATEAQLACLPTIGPALAARIVTFRTAHGPFREVKELQQVPGIGEARLARLLPYLRAP